MNSSIYKWLSYFQVLCHVQFYQEGFACLWERASSDSDEENRVSVTFIPLLWSLASVHVLSGILVSALTVTGRSTYPAFMCRDVTRVISQIPYGGTVQWVLRWTNTSCPVLSPCFVLPPHPC